MDEYDSLKYLALNLRSSWSHSTDAIWGALDPELWELTQNPWAVLQTVSKEKLSQFSSLIKDLVKENQEAMTASSWFQENHSESSLNCIAYFSMEYMLTEALPIYSGGLGNVAGDQLKAASDLNVPVVAIGLLYSQGYFRQFIDKNGEQQELYPYNDPGQLPIRPLRTLDGKWLRLKIDLPGSPLWLRTWEVQVGRRKLYLLDTNDIANFPAYRGITSELYGGNNELRLQQELVLGIGGWRLLEALELNPQVCHMNEGHAAFAILERALSYMKKNKQPFDVALAATRVGNHFTTHTAVTAGFDRFSPDLITKYLGNYATTLLGISVEKLLALGRINTYEDFNMAYLALRGSGGCNGVSRLHGVVSRRLFEGVFPRIPEEEVPVGHVTNGIHITSWDSAQADDLWTESCGCKRWFQKTEDLQNKIRAVPDLKIWNLRNFSRTHLVDYARRRLTRQLSSKGASAEELKKAQVSLNPDVLTLGFARRFASYKRPDLLLMDPERLIRILTNKERPVQLIIAGKAHPADVGGHILIKKWMDFIARKDVAGSVIFLSDYDMVLTEHLVEGVDLWINTPQRPWEACGTSGMKVLANGGLNLSELDGWWAEAYRPEVGWALGDGKEHYNDPGLDKTEANILYDLLEKEVIPQFYTRDASNIPGLWVAKIKESMATLTPYFSANRCVREYTEKYYLPAADAYTKRAANNGALGMKIALWQQSLDENWQNLKFGSVKSDQNTIEVEVYLGHLDPEAIKVELYSAEKILEMQYQGAISTGYSYKATVPPGIVFTPRIVPYFPGVCLPLEAPHILWQR